MSEVGFGLWTISTGWWGQFTEGEAIALMHKAFDLGITLFDAAAPAPVAAKVTLAPDQLRRPPGSCARAGFGGRDDGTFLDVAAGRVRLAGRTTPFVANGVLSLDGVRHRLGGLARPRATRLAERPDGCQFRLAGRGVTVDGTVQAPRKDLVGWVYADPAGGRHDAVNCSIATMRMAVRRRGQAPLELESAGGSAYELGMRERDHGVALQPCPDGPHAPD